MFVWFKDTFIYLFLADSEEFYQFSGRCYVLTPIFSQGESSALIGYVANEKSLAL